MPSDRDPGDEQPEPVGVTRRESIIGQCRARTIEERRAQLAASLDDIERSWRHGGRER